LKNIIELIGRPGSGKSFVARSILESGEIQVISNPDRHLKGRGYLGRLKAIWDAPVFSLLGYLCLLVRRKTRFDNYRQLYALQRCYIAMTHIRCSQRVVIDEGPINTTFSVLFGTLATRASTRVLRVMLQLMIKNIDAIILIKLGKEECVNNFLGRLSEKSRFSKTSDRDTIIKFIDDTTYDEIVKLLREVGCRKLYECNSAMHACELIAYNQVLIGR
jgi:adenylate kinase family enzyme